MKKALSILGLTMLLVICVGFSSCSEDDEEGGSNNSKHKIEFYLDGKLLPWIQTVDGYDYDEENNIGNTLAYYYVPNKNFYLDIHFAKNNCYNWFQLSVYKDINELKIGDNILDYNYIDYQEQKIRTYVEASYSTDFNEDYAIHQWNPWYGYDYPQNIGSITVKNIDTKKQIISFEIKDLLVWKYKYDGIYEREQYGYDIIQHIIDATIEMYYTIENE